MNYDFAPMEGITDYTFRKVYDRHFKGISRYYTPFLAPTPHNLFIPKDFREVDPESHDIKRLVPQLLTNDAKVFTDAAHELKEMGYAVVNLNLGCPSGTVTHKGKGAGALKYPERLEAFLDEIFSKADIAVSIKTRIGTQDMDEWERILEIYKKYPIAELIIHPRLLSDFYKGSIRIETFDKAYSEISCPLTYNGDIKRVSDISDISERFPKMGTVMIGRGLLSNPFLAEETDRIDKARIKEFLAELLDEYIGRFGNERTAIDRLKSIWVYLAESFDGADKAIKQIKKSQNVMQYRSGVQQVLQ